MIVGVRNPDAVRKVFEDCGDAVQARIPKLRKFLSSISGISTGSSFYGECARLCKTGKEKHFWSAPTALINAVK